MNNDPMTKTTTYPLIDAAKTGRNIRRIMALRRLSVREVQVFLGLCTPQGIYNWFSGRSIPSIDHLYALSELLRVPVDALLRGSRHYTGGSPEAACDRLSEYYLRLRHRLP